ncbi:MAG: helix-turn-helix domain-containing protein, partial [Candidatus Omnitrophica bacterium]|nr:helix-turn-helix domain-containing protein [Candidatus Omnitrophota bacterium]
SDERVAEAHLIALACSETPEGRNRWSVRLLADEMVALGYVDLCSKSTVHATLKKTNLSPI